MVEKQNKQDEERYNLQNTNDFDDAIVRNRPFVPMMAKIHNGNEVVIIPDHLSTMHTNYHASSNVVSQEMQHSTNPIMTTSTGAEIGIGSVVRDMYWDYDGNSNVAFENDLCSSYKELPRTMKNNLNKEKFPWTSQEMQYNTNPFMATSTAAETGVRSVVRNQYRDHYGKNNVAFKNELCSSYEKLPTLKKIPIVSEFPSKGARENSLACNPACDSRSKTSEFSNFSQMNRKLDSTEPSHKKKWNKRQIYQADSRQNDLPKMRTVMKMRLIERHGKKTRIVIEPCLVYD